MVILYSRLKGLASVFAFRHSKLAGPASSAFDPCLLPLPYLGSLPQDPQKSREEKPSQHPPVCLYANAIIPKGQGWEHQEIFNHAKFYLLRVLNHDLSLSEHLYVASKLPSLSLEPPDVPKHSRKAKTPAEVNDDFIVPDGAVDDSASEIDPETDQQDAMLVDSATAIHQALVRTLDMCWLVEQTGEKHKDSAALPLNGVLEVIKDGIAEKLSSPIPGHETLLELGTEAPAVLDIDEAAASVNDLLASAIQSTSNGKKPEVAPRDHDPVFMSLLPYITEDWKDGINVDLLQVYESLIRSDISPLPLNIPGRVRIEREKRLRSIAAEIFLAAHTICAPANILSAGKVDPNMEPTQGSNFLLPVRERDPVLPSSSQIAPAVNQPLYSSSPAAANLDLLESQPFPTEKTPGKDKRDFTEDPSSVYLRNLVSLTPQPLLPPKLSNILSHWRVGEDPASYDWEASKRLTAVPDEETLEAEQVRQKRNAIKAKKRARNNTLESGVLSDAASLQTQGESSSQPAFSKPPDVRSQEAPPVIASSQIVPESSQMGGSLGVSSQPLAGRFAGGKKAKKGRKKGF